MLELVAREFNSITNENALKWGVVHPNEDEWPFEMPDQFVDFGAKHGMHMLGHVLVWHSKIPHDLFKNGESRVSKEVLTKRMDNALWQNPA